mmetsp:Transcript_18867/g.31564  ORF Transcript_18867/g.31564 Transcript_18867/m.31564 type:complete len:106 (-) Transcript_18867:24-341(-)
MDEQQFVDRWLAALLNSPGNPPATVPARRYLGYNLGTKAKTDKKSKKDKKDKKVKKANNRVGHDSEESSSADDDAHDSEGYDEVEGDTFQSWDEAFFAKILDQVV